MTLRVIMFYDVEYWDISQDDDHKMDEWKHQEGLGKPKEHIWGNLGVEYHFGDKIREVQLHVQ